MSNYKKAPAFRLQIKQLYEAEVVHKGSSYVLKSIAGMNYNDIVLCGIITAFEPQNQPNNYFKVLIDDTTGSIWLDVRNYQFKEKLSLWKLFEIYGTIQILESSNDTFELSLIPQAIIPITDPHKELLHALDASYQTLHTKEIFLKYESSAGGINSRSEFSEDSLGRSHKNIDTDNEEFLFSENADDSLLNDTEFGIADNNQETSDTDSHTNIETQIIKIIRKEDTGKGVSFDSIREQLEKTKHLEISELEDIIFDLQMEGTIFEPTWRVYRLSE